MEKELCVSNTWLKREKKRKVTFRGGKNETENDFVMKKKEHRLFIQKVVEIPGEFQHTIMIADIDKKKIRKVVRKMRWEKDDNIVE